MLPENIEIELRFKRYSRYFLYFLFYAVQWVGITNFLTIRYVFLGFRNQRLKNGTIFVRFRRLPV